MPQPTPTFDSRPIVIPEIEQFGGAERSALALARWLHDSGLPCQIVTYADHCNFARYATHPLAVVELKAVGARNRAPLALPSRCSPATSRRCTPRWQACAASTP